MRVTFGAELLAQHRVARPRVGDPVADELLGRVVGLGDRGEVGFGVDLEVMGPEAAKRDFVSEGRQLEREYKIGVDPRTLVLRPVMMVMFTASQGRRSQGRRTKAQWASASRTRTPRAAFLAGGNAANVAGRGTSRVMPRPRRTLRHAGRIATTLTPRSTFVAMMVAVLVTVSLAACDDDSDRADAPNRSTSSSSSSGTSSSSPPPSSSTSGSSTPSPSTTKVSAGACGGQTDAIVEAINATDAQGLNQRAGVLSVQSCRLAASSPIWAAAETVAKPGFGIGRYTVVLERIGALWNVVDVGEAGSTGCGAPAAVKSDLQLGC